MSMSAPSRAAQASRMTRTLGSGFAGSIPAPIPANTKATDRTEGVLRRALIASHVRARIESEDTTAIDTAVFSPDGSLVAVAIEDGTVRLDLPPGQDLDEASAWQASLGRKDGVDSIAADGTVTYTEQARDAVAAVAPWLTEPLHPDAAPERADRIRSLLTL